MIKKIPVLAIDGPSGSGKGTISAVLAEKLGWHYLDSGAIYRVLAFQANAKAIDLKDVQGLVDLAESLDLMFSNGNIILEGKVIGDEIRTEQAGAHASIIAPIEKVRNTLHSWQRNQAKAPGLVADGRDMGTVVFADSKCKIFLTASIQARAERRFKQLSDKGFSVSIAQLFQEISKRDQRDRNRTISPLMPAEDAVVIDTTSISIKEVVDRVYSLVRTAFPF